MTVPPHAPRQQGLYWWIGGPGHGVDRLMSTDSAAYGSAEAVLGVGGRWLNQRDFPQPGAAGGETLIWPCRG